MSLELFLLGPPEIKLDGEPVSTDRRKAIALLAYLAVSGRSQARDDLAALLWPDYERDSAYAYLRRTLWELNQMLGKGWIHADRESVRLERNSDMHLDTMVFEETLHSTSADVDALAQAVDLYRGDFLAGFVVADTAPFEDWQFQQVKYFRREYARALAKLVDACIQVGDYDNALPFARRWLALDALDEAAHRAAMSVLAGMGDRTRAIRQYETCKQTLHDELEIEPQPETTELYDSILRGDIPAKTVEPSDGRQTGDTTPVVRLPVLPTPFIGRRPEVEQIKTLINEPSHRLITLFGPGGIGKTRLSIQAVSEVTGAFPHGVYFVPLGPVESVDGVTPAIARALQMSIYQEDESPRQQLLAYLGERRLLLLLDNFEHLLEAGELVSEILQQASNVKAVITSRIRLNIQGEQLYPVRGMRTADVTEASAWDDPEEQSKPFSGVQLFLERARRIQPRFTLTRENVPQVTQICQFVSGMPLGLELAASWLELLPPDEIATEIARSLDFLETEQADVPARQRSIRAVFESSWKLLSKDEQDTFLSLCVFVGSFSREAAQQVSGASLRTLLGLANKSWLQQTEDGCFQLHELMRQYGEEYLRADQTAWDDVRNRHAGYYLEFVDDQTRLMQSSRQVEGVRALLEEYETNVKKAWDWLVQQRRWFELIEKMATGFCHLGMIRMRTDEFISWFRAARLDIDPESNPEDRLAFAMISTAEIFCEFNSDIRDADPLGRMIVVWEMVEKYNLAEQMEFWYLLLSAMARGRNLTGDEIPMVAPINEQLLSQNKLWEVGMGYFLHANWWWGYDLDETLTMKAREIFERIGVIYEQGMVGEQLASLAFQKRKPLEEVISNYDNARRFYERMRGVTYSGTNMLYAVDFYFFLGEYDKGFEIFRQEQREFKERGQMRLYQYSLHMEALFAARYSTFEHAIQSREECLELVRKQGTQSEHAWQYFEMGDAYRIFGQPGQAIHYYDLARPLAEKINQKLTLGFERRAHGDIAIQDERYQEAMAYYQEFDRLVKDENHPWGLTQARGRLALAHAYLGDIEQARANMKAALADMYEWRSDDLLMQCLLVEVVCRMKEGNTERSIELASFLRSNPISWNETRQMAGDLLAQAAEGLGDQAVEAALERGKQLTLDVIAKKWFNLPD